MSVDNTVTSVKPRETPSESSDNDRPSNITSLPIPDVPLALPDSKEVPDEADDVSSGDKSTANQPSSDQRVTVENNREEQTDKVEVAPAQFNEAKTSKPKSEPYVNPDRFKTGGSQRDKISTTDLTERMNRIREKNEEIKQRRLAVEADEQAFVVLQQTDRIKESKNRKVQEEVNHSREENARRKLEKMGHREWDSSKKTARDKAG